MWGPRLAAAAILCLGAVAIYLILPFHVTLADRDPATGDVRLMLFMVGLAGSCAAIVCGIGGIVASFGIVRDGDGFFRPSGGILGRLIQKYAGDVKTFCGTSALCGIGVIAALAVTTIVLGIILLTVTNPAHGFGIMLVLALLGVIFFIGWSIMRLLRWLALRFPTVGNAVTLAIAVAVAGFVGYTAWTSEGSGGASLPSWQLMATAALSGVAIFAVAALGGLLHGKRFYRGICPAHREDAPPSA